ncbi:MAG: cytidine deaminase, partial [Actinomycetota bacterium]
MRSHSPYSGFRVGAAIRTTDGDVFACPNVENVAYPESTCAEAGAVSMMVASTGGDVRIAEVVTTAPAGDDGSPGTPCGGCRQKIREFST